MRSPRPSLLLVLLAVAGCGGSSTTTVTRPAPGASSAGSSASGSPVFFQGVAGPPQQRPTRLELTADGTLFVSGVQWSSWGGATATGTGNAEYHGCTPNCAQAPVQTALVSIRLATLRTCAGRRYYSGVTLTMNSGQQLDAQFLQRSWSPC